MQGLFCCPTWHCNIVVSEGKIGGQGRRFFYRFRQQQATKLMKKLSLWIVSLLCGQHLFAQIKPDSASENLFLSAVSHFENKKLDSAMAIWTRIAEERIGGDSYIYGNSLFNMGVVYLIRKDAPSAKTHFLRILASDVRDHDETGQLMEPHTNYKHKSAFNLARLAYSDSNFKEALDWIWKADTLYPYWGFEGSATNISKKNAALLGWKSHLLQRLNQREAAIALIFKELVVAGELSSFLSQSQAELYAMVDKSSSRQNSTNR